MLRIRASSTVSSVGAVEDWVGAVVGTVVGSVIGSVGTVEGSVEATEGAVGAVLGAVAAVAAVLLSPAGETAQPAGSRHNNRSSAICFFIEHPPLFEMVHISIIQRYEAAVKRCLVDPTGL